MQTNNRKCSTILGFNFNHDYNIGYDIYNHYVIWIVKNNGLHRTGPEISKTMYKTKKNIKYYIIQLKFIKKIFTMILS